MCNIVNQQYVRKCIGLTWNCLEDGGRLECGAVWVLLELAFRIYVVPCSLILPILNMKATLSSETSVLITPTRHHISEGSIFLNRRRINLKYYTVIIYLYSEMVIKRSKGAKCHMLPYPPCLVHASIIKMEQNLYRAT
jgi:hypothetical protein